MSSLHKFVTHPTYTGPGCAICGKEEAAHGPNAIFVPGGEKMQHPITAQVCLTKDSNPITEDEILEYVNTNLGALMAVRQFVLDKENDRAYEALGHIVLSLQQLKTTTKTGERFPTII